MRQLNDELDRFQSDSYSGKLPLRTCLLKPHSLIRADEVWLCLSITIFNGLDLQLRASGS